LFVIGTRGTARNLRSFRAGTTPVVLSVLSSKEGFPLFFNLIIIIFNTKIYLCFKFIFGMDLCMIKYYYKI